MGFEGVWDGFEEVWEGFEMGFEEVRSLTWLHTENKDEKIRQMIGGFKILLYFCRKISNMGKLAFLLFFILSV